MGALILPTNGTVYLDTNSFIYSIEKIDPYQTLLDMLWQGVSGGHTPLLSTFLVGSSIA